MPTESELRNQLHAHDDDPAGRIDLDAVLHGARRRRRPRTIAVTAVAAVAVVGIVVPVAIGIAGPQNGLFGGTSSAGSSASRPGDLTAPEAVTGGAGTPADGGVGSGGVGVAPAQKLNLCGGTLADAAPASNGLVLTVQQVDAAASARDIPVTVTLTNTGTVEFTGSASPLPTITFSRGGTVLWHSNGAVPSLAQVIDLAPGASTTFSTTFEPLVCGVEDDTRSSFRADLPSAGPGAYDLSAALDVSAEGGSSVLVTGPTAEATLR